MYKTQVTRRTFLTVTALATAMLGLPGCGASSERTNLLKDGDNSTDSEESASHDTVTSENATSKVLVTCFSATGNTRAVAQSAANHLGADYLEIEPEQPYTPEDLDYGGDTARATAEQNDGDTRPALASVPDFAAYDTVLLGFPIWWGKAPRLICTLLEEADLSGKAVAVFCTSGSSGIEDASSELQKIAPALRWIGQQRFVPGASDNEVAVWVDSL